MNKATFLQVLQKQIKKLPMDEQADIMAYYQEIIADGLLEDDEVTVIARLGHPKKVAREVTATFAMKELSASEGTVKDRPRKLWWVLMGIASSPIILPLAVSVIAVFIAIVAVVFAVLISYVSVFVSFIISGIGSLLLGGLVIAQDGVTAAFLIGCGLALIGGGCLLAQPFKKLWIVCFKLIANMIQATYLKFNRKRGSNQ